MLKLIKAIWTKNESAAYSILANIDWVRVKPTCHIKESGLSRPMHAIQSIVCGWFFLKLALFCFIWHPIFPNIGPHWATKQLADWDKWYADLNVKLKGKPEAKQMNMFDHDL